ncbi:TPA: hypothetical protein N0F65_010388 [Lagenidium giganteum]|uniref:E3 ubiquitin-protein ligase n=1 Tax=Lagenidium giganteum TaxID=4803 RepID=A0AAV2YU43_9STRA|nr:TPA: hypothetical protein N0F65_010388 [Lagenidium giganteum]
MERDVTSLFRDMELKDGAAAATATAAATTAVDVSADAHKERIPTAIDSEEEATLLSQLLVHLSPAAPARSAERAPLPLDALVEAFLQLPALSQKKIAQSLFVIPPSLVDNFARVLDVFMRVIMAAHAPSHESTEPHATPGRDTAATQPPPVRSCHWQHVAHLPCMQLDDSDSDVPGRDATVLFHFPPEFHACLIDNYGSVKKSKCEEVWNGDHMAYRCRTCGLSDSSCMCLACFDPDEHEGHDYRVYRCSSGGCCDCGDPLAWKPEGFCKKHRVSSAEEAKKRFNNRMAASEEATVELLVRRVVAFCINVLREIYLFCLRPGTAFESDPFYPMRTLPKTGRRRNSFPGIIQVHQDRLQLSFSWLQMLAMSCLKYRDIVSRIFFEELPPDFHLDPPSQTMPHPQPPPVVPGAAHDNEKAVENEDQKLLERNGTSSQQRRQQAATTPVGGKLLILDVFLKAGVLLPVEICDVLGVLYLKLLFDQDFKQQYTCHFVDWYPYFVNLYLKASDENNEEGMRNLSRFIDRLFCQLFHSTAQLRELEKTFSARESDVNNQLRRHHARDSPLSASSCVENLMVFLLEKLYMLFKNTLRVETIQVKGNKTSDPARGGVLQSIYVVDCGRNVFKKRIYARLCSDLRTLLVHPQVAAEALLRSFDYDATTQQLVMREGSVYSYLMKTFEVLQQMDMQQRHVDQHIEYESQNWTFAFVVDYEMNLLLGAFLSGIPQCFTPNLADECLSELPAPFNPRDTATFDRLALARAILQPLQSEVLRWTRRNGCPEWRPPGSIDHPQERTQQLMAYYERGDVFVDSPMKKSFHLPLHHMYASLVESLCSVLPPATATNWMTLLGLELDPERAGTTEFQESLVLLSCVVEHPLRVCLYTREVKAGLWVRNGNVMWQQLIHYYSKHWRFHGLHSDLFLCQLATMLLPKGCFARMFFSRFPFRLENSRVFTVQTTASRDRALSEDDERSVQSKNHELDLAEEFIRLLLQVVLSPVKLCSSTFPSSSLTWLLEREMMHWLSLGPFTRSEVTMRMDMKLVEQVKQFSDHPWHLLEEEEILTNVLESVGVYEDPSVVGRTGASGAGSGASTGPNLLGYGLKMSGSWRLKEELWNQVSPLFECFTPSEAQQSEQNVRKHLNKLSSRETSVVFPVLPRPEFTLHGVLVDRLLNSPFTLAVFFSTLMNWKISDDERLAADDRPCTENLLVNVLYGLYVASELTPATEDKESLEHVDISKRQDLLRTQSVDAVASWFDDNVSLFANVCVELPIQVSVSASVLSLLVKLSDGEACPSDARPLVARLLTTFSEKSSLCRAYIQEQRRELREARGASSSVEMDGGASSTDAVDAHAEKENSARELMKKRQQMILERMRSQQMSFLSKVGGSTDAERNGTAHTQSQSHGVDIDDDGDDGDDDEDDEEEEDDEWGFPTGQVGVDLYLNHVTSAIAQSCEREKRTNRKRRRTRTSSTAEDDASDECALCRLPCENNSPNVFGYVAMVMPTCAPRKLGFGACAFPSLMMKPVEPKLDNGMNIALGDALVWSCGHMVHQACLKGYLVTFWKQKQSQATLEVMNGEDRLLSQNDTEFLCPICRRLSNCLVPSVVDVTTLVDRSSSSTSRSTDMLDMEEEEKDEERAIFFSKWLELQLQQPPNLRERSNSNGNGLRGLTGDAAVRSERQVREFTIDVLLRCLRGALSLPLLMLGDDDGADARDEVQVELEVQLLATTCTAYVPAWQVLTRGVEVQVAVLEREQALFGTDAAMDRHRAQAFKRLISVATAALQARLTATPNEPNELDMVLAKMYGVLFGHQVLFEDDDGEASSRLFLSAPMLSHPNLFAFFALHVLTQCAKAAASASGTAESRREEVLSSAFFLARVLVTARVLQALLAIVVDHAHAAAQDEDVAASAVTSSAASLVEAGMARADSLADVLAWLAQLLCRARVIRHAPAIPLSVAELEARVGAACLPLLRQMQQLLQLCVPISDQDDDVGVGSSASAATGSSDELCAVCDGLFGHAPRSAVDRALRRFHLPPLRLFFHARTFSTAQRSLCELWGAQLESKAAVVRCRNDVDATADATVASPSTSVLSALSLLPSAALFERGKLLVALPRVYMDLFIKYSEKPLGLCPTCCQLPQHPAVCLFCGVVLCCFSACCEVPHANVGECTQHAQTCGLGTGAFLLLRACTVILFLGNERRCVWGSLYVDKNGEEDPYLRRGKTLYLDAARLLALEALLISQGFAQNTAILANTSRRDGRRY